MSKTVLVTGGAKGIGRAIAEEMLSDHAVSIVWHQTTADGLPKDIFAMQADLTIREDCERVIKDVMERFGRLDIIVNNAGVVSQTHADDFSEDAARKVLETNLIAPATLLSLALPHLASGASIVNISSMNAELPPKDASIYGASKAGLNLWTKAMAKELGPKGIRVNAIAPGAINIPESPRPEDLTHRFVKETALGRIGTPQDIAKAVRFLASDDAEFITGEVLTVSGGYRL